MSDPDDHDVPLHLTPQPLFALPLATPLPPVPPAANPLMDPAFQATMMGFFTAMTQQMQMQNVNNAPQPPVHDPPAHCSCVKTCDLEPYDGSDPAKLHSFLSQCKLVFGSWPDEYRRDSPKIMFAVSWLKGTAQCWFKPNLSLNEEDLPDFALTWQGFEEAAKLDNLTMKDHHHLNKYNVDFNEYSILTGFDECALYAKYYKGLAPCIKDALVYSGRPVMLARLREQAQEHVLASTPKASSLSSRSSGTVPATSTPSRALSQSKASSRSSTPTASSSKSNKPDLSKVLGPDSKLLLEEKERHKKNDLCMVCSSKDHFADKCPQRKDSAQARAAAVEDIVETEELADSSSGAESSDSQN